VWNVLSDEISSWQPESVHKHVFCLSFPQTMDNILAVGCVLDVYMCRKLRYYLISFIVSIQKLICKTDLPKNPLLAEFLHILIYNGRILMHAAVLRAAMQCFFPNSSLLYELQGRRLNFRPWFRPWLPQKLGNQVPRCRHMLYMCCISV
jgi:hypothetical protein